MLTIETTHDEVTYPIFKGKTPGDNYVIYDKVMDVTTKENDMSIFAEGKGILKVETNFTDDKVLSQTIHFLHQQTESASHKGFTVKYPMWKVDGKPVDSRKIPHLEVGESFTITYQPTAKDGQMFVKKEKEVVVVKKEKEQEQVNEDKEGKEEEEDLMQEEEELMQEEEEIMQEEEDIDNSAKDTAKAGSFFPHHTALAAKKAELSAQAIANKEKLEAAQALLDAAEKAKKRELEEQAAAEAAAKLEQMEKDTKIVDDAVNDLMSDYAEICKLQEQVETLKKKYLQKAFNEIDDLSKDVISDPKDVAVKVGKNKNVNSFDVFKSRPENAKLYKKLYRQGVLLNRVEVKNPRNLHDDVKRAFNAYANANPIEKKQFDEDLAKFLKEAKKPKEKVSVEEKPRKRKFVSRMADRIEKKLKML